jgi:hypothetical protein
LARRSERSEGNGAPAALELEEKVSLKLL